MTARPETLKSNLTRCITGFTLSLALVLPAGYLAAQDLDKAQAESRLGEVTLAIGKLQARLEASRTDFRKEQARIREVDLAIQEANLNFRALEQEQSRHLDELGKLENQRERYLSNLEDRMEQLAKQVRSAYKTGRQSRIKLVLNQDNPSRLGRLLAYYDYLNRAQVRNITSLKETLNTLDDMQQAIDQELSRIEALQNEQRAVLEELGRKREERELLLGQLSSRIDSDESRLQELEQNRKDLEALLDRLTDALADIPADLGTRMGVAMQKGKLPMPLKGRVKYAFGQARAGGLRWQGWLIESPAGAEAHAVAYGRVAFADWLRGYGLMIILDHGQGFLSLYGHNESLLREVGAWVEPGEIIGIVGSNPGADQGLYFELRKDGKALDPAAWLHR